MLKNLSPETYQHHLLAGPLQQTDIQSWLDSMLAFSPAATSDLQSLTADAAHAGALIHQGWRLFDVLPRKSERDAAQRQAADALLYYITTLSRNVCRVHRNTMYEQLTDNYHRFLRVDELMRAAGERWPWMVPPPGDLEQECKHFQKDKDGLELLQGIMISQFLGEPRSGIHLLHSMLRPRAESLELLPAFVRDNRLELEHAVVEISNGAATVNLTNTRFLNAEDDLTTRDQEIAIDLVLLHPEISLGVLRGARVEHPRYKNRRVFSSGINLTKIYQGKMPYLMYLLRDFGLVNKLYYGLAGDTWNEDEPNNSVEKPWIGVIENFAIGGGCQLLLTMDYVLAESGAYFNLPARKEGIVPGAANLRLARYLGESVAREAILFDRTFYVDSPEAAGLVNKVVPRERIDATLQEIIDNALGSGVVSAAGNRKALRIGSENLETYRRYMANYAEIQAFCHLSSQLVENLEKYWNAKQRKL